MLMRSPDVSTPKRLLTTVVAVVTVTTPKARRRAKKDRARPLSRIIVARLVVVGTINPLERTREYSSGIRGQPLDCVALIEDDVVDL